MINNVFKWKYTRAKTGKLDKFEVLKYLPNTKQYAHGKYNKVEGSNTRLFLCKAWYC